MKELKHQWSILSTGQPFEYSFMDEDFNALYKTEQQTETISLLFTTLFIIIACLGLFALSSYTAEKRSQGNKHPESVRRQCAGYSRHDVQRFSKTDFNRQYDWNSGCLDINAFLA